MGQDWRPNKAISIGLLLLLLEAAELKVQEALSLQDKNRRIVFHTYVATCYTISLREGDGFLLDLGGLNRKLSAGGDKYVIVALLGQIKGESGDRAHLLPCVPITSSDIVIKTSLLRLLEFKRMRGCVVGPAISDLAGKVLSHGALNDSLLESLEELFEPAGSCSPPQL
jgi:hypothetical protein